MKIPAVFMRGGTSKAVVFHEKDLPADRQKWDAIFLSVMGSPDPHGRQLNGMGGGLSSLSKVCVIGPPSRPDADIDYTFAQVLPREPRVDYSGNCGNMSSAVGPFAVDEGLVRASGGQALVRIHNTNTRKIIHSHFPVEGSRAAVEGDMQIPGVAGSGAAVRLDFIDPGGASTGQLLPTGRAMSRLHIPDLGAVDVSMVDAANACVFVDARTLGLRGNEMPDALDSDPRVLRALAAIREHASVAMGIAPDLEAARRRTMIPLIAFVSAPMDSATLSGTSIAAADADLTVRMISNGQPHRALPVTGALCTAVAASIEETIPQRLRRKQPSQAAIRLGMPSGVLTVGAEVGRDGALWVARRGSFYRTARRLFEGHVHA
jgi:2-methylaconitate cis-trans-isomerase PrpF